MLITLGNLTKTKKNEFKITNMQVTFWFFPPASLHTSSIPIKKEMLNFNMYFSALIEDTALQAFNLEEKKKLVEALRISNNLQQSTKNP